MKCHLCSWTGPFKSYGGHMWREHRPTALRNLRKAQSPASKRKAAQTRARHAAKEASSGSAHSSRSTRKARISPDSRRIVASTIVLVRCPSCGAELEIPR
jgi:fibronectin type 3 domain-containing protein